MVPRFNNGKPNGIKLFSLRPGSMFYTAGIRNGDVLRSINGVDVGAGPSSVLSLMAERDAGKSWELVVEQESGTMTARFEFR